jgi:hypothetical protein
LASDWNVGWVPMGERAYERAEEVQQMMTEVGQHRSAGPIDLLIAAAAEQARLTILCEDHDFEEVASVTRQRVRLVTDIQTPPDGPRSHEGTGAGRSAGKVR